VGLDKEIRAAIDDAGEDYEARLRAVAAAYVRFATRDPALMELMFAAKNAEQSAALREAFGRVFDVFGDLIREGSQAGALPQGDPERLRLLLVATMQGIATLITSRRVHDGQTDTLISDAIALFTRGRPELGDDPVPASPQVISRSRTS
jgi:AcrR family transcriptional regulator